MVCRAGRVELVLRRVFVVAQHEDDLGRLAGLQAEPDVVRADGRPAVGDGVGRLAALDDHRVVPAAVGAEEGLALGVEADQRGLTVLVCRQTISRRVDIVCRRIRTVSPRSSRTREIREVIAPLAVLGLVVDHAAVDLDLAGVEVALEVGLVVPGVPQVELHGREQRQLGRGLTPVGHAQPPDLQVGAQRHEVQRAGLDAVGLRADDGVAHAMAAGVGVQGVRVGIQEGDQNWPLASSRR